MERIPKSSRDVRAATTIQRFFRRVRPRAFDHSPARPLRKNVANLRDRIQALKIRHLLEEEEARSTAEKSAREKKREEGVGEERRTENRLPREQIRRQWK